MIDNAPEKILVTYVILREDTYETQFGDGYYAYFEDAFFTPEEAEASISIRPVQNMINYHIKALYLKREQDQIIIASQLKFGDQVTVDNILTALNSKI